MWQGRSLHPYLEFQPDPDKYFSAAMKDLNRNKCQIQISVTTKDLIEACDRALQELNPDLGGISMRQVYDDKFYILLTE